MLRVLLFICTFLGAYPLHAQGANGPRSTLRFAFGYTDAPEKYYNESGINYFAQFTHRTNFFSPFNSLAGVSAQPTIKASYRSIHIDNLPVNERSISVISFFGGLHFNFLNGIYGSFAISNSDYKEEFNKYILLSLAESESLQAKGLGFEFGVGYESYYTLFKKMRMLWFVELTVTNEKLSAEVDMSSAQVSLGTGLAF
jgi:hypothetical protein